MWWMEEQCHWVASNLKIEIPAKLCKISCALATLLWTYKNVLSTAWIVVSTSTVMWLRQLLLSTGIWGSVGDAVQTRLHRAYLDFKSWCSQNRIACSQPAFQQKNVAWYGLTSVISWRVFVNYHCLFGSGCWTCDRHVCARVLMLLVWLSCINAMAMFCSFAKRSTDAWWCNG